MDAAQIQPGSGPAASLNVVYLSVTQNPQCPFLPINIQNPDPAFKYDCCSLHDSLSPIPLRVDSPTGTY